MTKFNCTKERSSWIKPVLLSLSLSGTLLLSPLTSYASQIYHVQSGDSLWKISQKFSVNNSTLSSANNLTNTNLLINQSLVIPAPQDKIYTIQPGDSLFLIAQKFHTSIDQLKADNNLATDWLMVGNHLVISSLSETENILSDNQYAVVSGDSLYLIAKRFNTTTDKLIALNYLSSTTLNIGQVLLLPSTSLPSNTVTPNSTTSTSIWDLPSEVILYHVQSGDSISTIATKYASSVSAIITTNHLNNDFITPGFPLMIPQNSKSPIYGLTAPHGSQKAGYGELLDWEYANWFFPFQSQGTIKDLATGKTFNITRIGGGNHADCEPSTAKDTAVMKELYNNTWSWSTRPVILQFNGREIAASMAGMPHAFDSIAANNFNGMFDLHFLHSRTHNTNAEDPNHQNAVLTAAGMK